MESKNVQTNVEHEDRFSKLPDEILLRILEKANTHTSIRASSLSSRWKPLPSFLPHISLDVSDFMHSKSTSVDQLVIDEAMAAITKAVRICLAARGSESTVKTVSLHLVLTVKYFFDIGKLISQAIEIDVVKNEELALPTEKLSLDCDEGDMVQHAKTLVYFSHASPNLFRSLTRLCLHNTRFGELQMHRLLHSCEQLQHLELDNCDSGDLSVLKIDMPNSKISYLRLDSCCFERVEFLCLPKLAGFTL